MRTGRLGSKNGILVFVVVLLAGTSTVSGQEHITFLHWNDFHAQNLPVRLVASDSASRWVGGAAVFKAYLDSMRTARPNSIALNAGDEFQGSPVSTLTHGRSQIILLNLLQPDVFELGNHELDYGRRNLEELIPECGFSVLGANVIDSLSEKPIAAPFVIKRVGGVKVGIVGIMTENLYNLTMPGNLTGLRVASAESTVIDYATEMAPKVDLTVVLSHSGFVADSILATQVPTIDVIFGGHSHNALAEPTVVNGVIITQAGAQGKYLGVLELWVDTHRKTIDKYEGHLLTTYVDGIRPDRRVQAVVDSLEAVAGEELNKVVATLAVAWKRRSRRESNIGNWQADAMRRYTGADVALQNSGGIRKDMPPGEIRVRDMWEINPFSNYFVSFNVSGEELRQILETQANSPKEFFQVSGLTYRYTSSAPVGQRVVEVRVNGLPLSPDKRYRVATNNFVLSHFEEFFGISRGRRDIRIFPKLDREVFLEEARREGTIHSRLEGRVSYLPDSSPETLHSSPR